MNEARLPRWCPKCGEVREHGVLRCASCHSPCAVLIPDFVAKDANEYSHTQGYRKGLAFGVFLGVLAAIAVVLIVTAWF